MDVDELDVYHWIRDRNDWNSLYGGERIEIDDEDIERLKNGEMINFFVNQEYGCLLQYIGNREKKFDINEGESYA